MVASSCVTWEALGWIHDMAWYREMLRASWFKPILPYWREYHLDWVALLVLFVLLIVLLKAIFGHRVKLSKGPARARKQRKLALKAAEHYLSTGEKMMAVDAYLAAAKPRKALDLLVEMKSWSRAATLAEQMGKVDDAVEYYRLSKDTASVAQVLLGAGRAQEAAAEYEKQGRLVDAAKLYVKEGMLKQAGQMYEQIGMHGRAAELFIEQGDKDRALASIRALLSGAAAGFTEEECALLIQGAAILYDKKEIKESAMMLEAAGQLDGAVKRYEICGARNDAARCYEKLGKTRKAADLTDDPQTRLSLIEKMQQNGQKVPDAQLAKALRDAGQHEAAVDLFLKIGDEQSAIEASLEAGNPSYAAKIMADGGKNLDAARLFMDAGDLEAAREQFLLAGDRLSAAQVAMQSGMYLKAGEEFFSIGKYEEAIKSLQQIHEQDSDYRMASSMMGKAFFAMGEPDLAFRMHKRAVANLAIKKDNLELFYNMARFLEALGGKSANEAAQVYGSILEVDYAFRDVRERKKTLVPGTP